MLLTGFTEKKMIIIKFGGTSICDIKAVSRVLNIIKNKLALHKEIVVVVSAMGKVTNKLTYLANLAFSGNRKDFQKCFNELKLYHMEILEGSCADKKLLKKTRGLLNKEFLKISGFGLKKKFVFLTKALKAKDCDYMISFGEKISSIIMNAALNSSGIKTKLIGAPEFMITDTNYTNARPLFDIVYKKLPKIIKPYFEDFDLVLTQGFIGKTKSGISTTIGREGSDCTAAIVGAGLDAEKIEIWTDVNGVMTADPRIVKDAKNIPEISYKDMACLSFCGAKVVHPGTIAPAKDKKIPIYVLNSYNKSNKGTVIRGFKNKSEKLNNIIAVTGKIKENNGRFFAYVYIIGRNLIYMGKLRKTIDALVYDGIARVRNIKKNKIELLANENMLKKTICCLHEELIENTEDR